MKRRDLIRHLESHGCQLLREGGPHSVYVNPAVRKVSSVPRHNEVNDHLARKICKDLDVPRVRDSLRTQRCCVRISISNMPPAKRNPTPQMAEYFVSWCAQAIPYPRPIRSQAALLAIERIRRLMSSRVFRTTRCSSMELFLLGS